MPMTHADLEAYLSAMRIRVDPLYTLGVGGAAPPSPSPPGGQVLVQQSFGVLSGALTLGIIRAAQAIAVEAAGGTGGAAAQLRVQVSAAAITLGGTMRAAGTSPPVVTLTAGTGSLSFAAGTCPGLRVEIDSVVGGTARGQATCRISYNSGSTWAHSGVTTAATYSIPDGPAAGCVINFPTGTYGTTQSWEGTVASLTSTEGSAYTFANATVAQQPVFRDAAATPDGKDGLFFNNGQVLISTDAAVIALFTNDPALTVAARVAYTTADAAGHWLSAADSAQSTNRQRRYGQFTTGLGRDVQVWANDAGTVTVHTCTTDPLTGDTAAHNVMHYGPGSGGAINLDVNGATETMSPATAAIGTLTPNRVGIGALVTSSIGQFHKGYLYDLAVFASELSPSDRSTWNTNLAAGT